MPQASASLVFGPIELRPPPKWASVWELRFDVINTGDAKAVLRTIRLLVDDARPSSSLRMVEAGAPITLHRHRVKLDPTIREYDVRERVFGAAVEPRAFAPDEVEAFIVELGSTRGYWYRLHLVADWYETRSPGVPRETISPALEVEFSPEPEELLARYEPASPAIVPVPSRMNGLSNVEIGELQETLVRVFERGALARLLEYGLGVRLDEVSSNATLPDQVSELIRWCEARGRLEELIEKAHQAAPQDPSLGRLVKLVAPLRA